MKKNLPYNKIVYIICLTGALGGLLFGLDQGFIANALHPINKIYSLNLSQSEHYSAILAWGGILGTIFSGFLSRIVGRKRTLILSGLIFTCLSFSSSLVPNFTILLYCRFGIGFAIGLVCFTVPIYLSETSPTSIRGSMSTLFQLMITIGILLISLTNTLLIFVLGETTLSLSLMFGVSTIFSLIMLLSSMFLPESPRWYVLKKNHDKAIAILKKIYKDNCNARKELISIKKSVASNSSSRFDFLYNFNFFKVLILGMTLQIFQQLVGINMIIYYAPTVFDYANLSGFIALIIVPITNMLFTIPAIKLVDRWGRKKLLYIGSIIMMIAMLLFGLSFLGMKANFNINKMILLFSAIIYIIGFACSWGPIPWIICAEIFPLKYKEIGITITTIINWVFAGIVLENSLSFMQNYGNYSIFFLFCGFCFISLLFLKYFVPETKNVSLETIEKNLHNKARLKNIGI